ncbi:MAG: c-type cytochrome [Flavobacteriaceae bacterium]
MRIIKNLFGGLFLCISFVACYDSSQPNYQYFPNMYEPIGYEAYAESEAFRNGIEAQIPVDGTISRGWTPYDFPNSNEGYETAKSNLKSPIEFNKENLKKGKDLYGVYCAVCHGNKGNGQGILMTREKYLGVPSYADREITEGSIYHVIFFGKNAMGSHAGQVNETERWQITQYVMELRSKLK